ncbi:hypothetical protein GH714_039167 [Hevea brasiliensis]|uniref:Uncharacterized protein n=1 Tax=Hevea brasiliensis TaxID=3981 RepID=A0A6A6KPC2_HEVBR|nr:hypothetical protein GH714_039167 [Hevea brasiliensis]
MTDQPRFSINNLRTTSHLIKQASASFSANLFTFLLLSLLLFSFRSLVESGTHVLTSFIDRDPSLRSLLSRLDLSGRHLHPHHRIQRFPPRRHRRPFLHLTRVGTLDDDFFSGDDDTDRSLFGPNRKLSPNGSSVILYNLDPGLGFSEYVVDNGIKISETVHSGIQFKVDSLLMNSSDRESTDYSDNEKEEEEEEENGSFLSAAYGWVILGFTAIYSWILGIIFVAVVNDLLGRFTSFVAVVWDGSRLGLKRLTGFILMRWAVRDALTQLIGLWYFVDAWVTIVDSRRTGREIIKEGCYLISTLFNQAVQIKSMETILCGSAARWLLTRVFGKFLAAVFQSAVEVYFMVAWLIFYFAARCKEAHSEGRRFGRRELEGLIDGLG